MSTNEQLNGNEVTIVKDKVPEEWGDKGEIGAIARRLKYMLPNGSKMSDEQAYAAAQYSRLTGLDPFTGGFYVLAEGGVSSNYKIKVAWAQDKEPFNEKYFPLTPEERAEEGMNDAVEAQKCYLIKRSQQPFLVQMLQAGLSLVETLDLIATKGIGMVEQSDLVTKSGSKRNPPKGWTWVGVAKKRALINAIGRGYGQPTLDELRSLGQRLKIEGLDTLSPTEMPHAAKLMAAARQAQETSAEMTPEQRTERLRQNTNLLRGDDNSVIGEYTEVDPEKEFYERVLVAIPYYKHIQHIKNTLAKLGLEYDQANEDGLTEELNIHANQKADAGAAESSEEAQLGMFGGSELDEAFPREKNAVINS